MSSSTEQSQPHAFMAEEITRALQEQSFGIASFEVISTSSMKATARVVLLEKEPIMVALTSRGFQLQSLTEPPMDPDLDAEAVYETVEQLLHSVSPQYETARRSALLAKLDALSSENA